MGYLLLIRVNRVLECFSRIEFHYIFSLDLYLLPGLGIYSFSGFSSAHLECAKTGYCHSIVPFQGIDYGIYNAIYHSRSLTFGFNNLSDFINKFLLLYTMSCILSAARVYER